MDKIVRCDEFFKTNICKNIKPRTYILYQVGAYSFKPKLSTNFDAISLDTSNLTSSQTKWVYL